MNKRLKLWAARMMVAVLLALAVPFSSLASTAKIAFSDPSTEVGAEVDVTMKFTSTSGETLGNTDVMLSYDATMLEYMNNAENASGGAGAIRVWSAPDNITEVVTVLRFKALKAGTTTIKVSSWEAYDNNGGTMTVEKEGTSTIKIAALETSSDDASLVSLQISPGTLEPSFQADTVNYTTSVGLDVDKLTVSAAPASSNATVTVAGESDLKEGENTVTCTVTAEDGTTTKTYTITVNKVEGGDSGAATDSSGSEPTQAEPEVLAELNVTAKKIRIIAKPDDVEIPAGFKPSTIAIGDTKVEGWTWAADETPRFCVFYGMNEEGNADFYRYDLSEKTVQRYFSEGSSQFTDADYTKLGEEYNSLVDDYSLVRILLIVFVILSVVLGVVAVVALSAARKGGSGRGGRGSSGYGYSDLDPLEAPRKKTQAPREVHRTSRGKRLTKEERYMMGEEAEYEEDADDLDPLEYQPQRASRQAAATQQPGTESSYDYREESRQDGRQHTADMEQELSKDLARSAKEVSGQEQQADDSGDADDFEILDLDEDEDK